ncbi:MAG: hypothetical protein LBP83_06910 [Dysgonamonadaceae bacterium]|jgi:hypothetical protein|nr:hypothetical protein [Dysgonamonadaceae bacterium]
MKLKLFLITASCLCLAHLSRAQLDDRLPTNEEMYILDGQKNYFAYGRYLTPNQIAIGLSDEGVYELRNDTAVWLISHPVIEETLLVTVREEEETGNLFFLFTLPNGTVADTIGIYDSERNEIFDKVFEPLASVDISNNCILSRQAETLLLVYFPAVNRRLAVFFFLHHCLPIKQQGII